MTATALLIAGTLFAAQNDAAAEQDGGPIEVQSVLVTLIEQVEVPARETGVLQLVDVREGDVVEKGSLLGRIEDSHSRLEELRAKIELDKAVQKAESDVEIRAARKSQEVAQAELKRAMESVEKYRKSISATELDRLKLTLERAELSVEQSQEDIKMASLERNAKANELDLAKLQVERRQIVAPITGVVVQVNGRQGEWVKPGDAVVRILRMNRLRAEGFINANSLAADLNSLANRPVALTVELPGMKSKVFRGTLVFVSPEINPVNGQVRVWAEIENDERLLRPGMKASMTIDPLPRQASTKE